VSHHRTQFFKDDEQEFLTAIALGAAAYRASEAGEVLATIREVEDGDRGSWVDAWAALAERVRGIADGTSGPSARDACLRAAMYYGMAAFGAVGAGGRERWDALWAAGRDAWREAARLLGAVEVEIPYEDATMPGWLFVPDGAGPHPLAIIVNGSDGSNVDAWVQGGAAALERGYASLIFDGPGQNAMLHERNVGFRPDWEAVITPIVDWALARDDIDGEAIVMAGVSQAGFWVPRAAAFEHRLAAAVADPGVVDVSTSWLDHLPGSMRSKLERGDRDGFDRAMGWGVRFSKEARFQLGFRGAPYGIDDPFDLYAEVLRYRLDAETAARIRCPMLITDPEHETFWPGQSQQLYDMLTCEKTLLRFTAAEGGDLHCEPRAPTLRNQRVFDWLDGVLGRTSAAA
jgi:hypothetical protein